MKSAKEPSPASNPEFFFFLANLTDDKGKAVVLVDEEDAGVVVAAGTFDAGVGTFVVGVVVGRRDAGVEFLGTLEDDDEGLLLLVPGRTFVAGSFVVLGCAVEGSIVSSVAVGP